MEAVCIIVHSVQSVIYNCGPQAILFKYWDSCVQFYTVASRRVEYQCGAGCLEGNRDQDSQRSAHWTLLTGQNIYAYEKKKIQIDLEKCYWEWKRRNLTNILTNFNKIGQF
jgi:hypothetical protein